MHIPSLMFGRLNQFASIPALSLAGKELRIQRRKKKKEEDKKAEVQVINDICPTDYADVLTIAGSELGIDRMRFGLVPGWAKGTKAEVGKKFGHTFNARCESIFEFASFRSPILRQRCLIPVRGGHEWPDRSAPYFIHRTDDAPLLHAGIWESPYPEDFESRPVTQTHAPPPHGKGSPSVGRRRNSTKGSCHAIAVAARCQRNNHLSGNEDHYPCQPRSSTLYPQQRISHHGKRQNTP